MSMVNACLWLIGHSEDDDFRIAIARQCNFLLIAQSKEIATDYDW